LSKHTSVLAHSPRRRTSAAAPRGGWPAHGENITNPKVSGLSPGTDFATTRRLTVARLNIGSSKCSCSQRESMVHVRTSAIDIPVPSDDATVPTTTARTTRSAPSLHASTVSRRTKTSGRDSLGGQESLVHAKRGLHNEPKSVKRIQTRVSAAARGRQYGQLQSRTHPFAARVGGRCRGNTLVCSA